MQTYSTSFLLHKYAMTLLSVLPAHITKQYIWKYSMLKALQDV